MGARGLDALRDVRGSKAREKTNLQRERGWETWAKKASGGGWGGMNTEGGTARANKAPQGRPRSLQQAQAAPFALRRPRVPRSSDRQAAAALRRARGRPSPRGREQ